MRSRAVRPSVAHIDWSFCSRDRLPALCLAAVRLVWQGTPWHADRVPPADLDKREAHVLFWLQNRRYARQNHAPALRNTGTGTQESRVTPQAPSSLGLSPSPGWGGRRWGSIA